MSLADALEQACQALPALADSVRPANGDPDRVLDRLSQEEATALMVWLLASEPGAAESIGSAWLEREEGARAVAAIPDASLPKTARKVLRKLQHRLRSRGHALPATPTPERVATLPRVEDDISGAFVSPLDPSGGRAVVVVEPNPQGGARIFELVCDESRGVLHCEVYSANRGQARRFLRDATARTDRAGVAVSRDAACAIVARAARAQAPDRSLPRAYEEWRSRLAPAEGALSPGEDVAEALGSEPEGSITLVTEMLREGRVGPWPPPEALLRQAVAKLDEAATSPIIVSGASQGDRIRGIVAETADAAFDPTFCAQTGAKFAETAYVFWRRGEEAEARACLAAARCFAAGGTPGAGSELEGEARATASPGAEPTADPVLEHPADAAGHTGDAANHAEADHMEGSDAGARQRLGQALIERVLGPVLETRMAREETSESSPLVKAP